jgi:uncharacterized protein YcnI
MLFFFSSMASAHVTVMPKTSSTGAWETYTLKVPVEKDVATTKVTVKAPEGVEIMSYQPVPGWTYSSEKDASGKVKTITFESTGEGIQAGQFQQFVFVAKNPDKAVKAAWDAFQYYKDGSVVEWTGDEGSDAPHSITDIVRPPPLITMAAKMQNILSGIAALLSLAALVIAIRKNYIN